MSYGKDGHPRLGAATPALFAGADEVVGQMGGKRAGGYYPAGYAMSTLGKVAG